MASLIRYANNPYESDLAVLEERKRLLQYRELPGFKELKEMTDQQILNKARSLCWLTIIDESQLNPKRSREEIYEELKHLDIRANICEKELAELDAAAIKKNAKPVYPKTSKGEKGESSKAKEILASEESGKSNSEPENEEYESEKESESSEST